MNNVPPILCGSRATFTVQALDSAMADVEFSASDTPSLRIYPGGGRSTTLTVTGSWNDEVNGLMDFTITEAQSLAITPAIYKADARVTLVNTNVLEVWSGYLEFRPAPGSVAAGLTYCALSDVQAYYPGIEKFQTANDVAGFAYHREQATKLLNTWIYNRFDPQPGFQKRRGSTFDSIYGYDVIDQTTTPLAKETLRTLLADGKLELDREAIEMTARIAVSMILARNVSWVANTSSTVPKTGDNPMQSAALDQRAKAKEIFDEWKARVDANEAGETTILLDRDCIYLSGYTA